MSRGGRTMRSTWWTSAAGNTLGLRRHDHAGARDAALERGPCSCSSRNLPSTGENRRRARLRDRRGMRRPRRQTTIVDEEDGADHDRDVAAVDELRAFATKNGMSNAEEEEEERQRLRERPFPGLVA